MNFALLILLLSIIAMLYYIDKRIKVIQQENKLHREWLFDALYSINHNVKLPDENVNEIYEPAIVTYDSTDPMGEFDGRHDDFHQEPRKS